jgi:uncharacterized protein (UPF0332 family)
MTFDWYQYLVLAEYLYDNRDTFPDREACLRAAISKAYYAAFCLARNYARDFVGVASLKENRLVLDESAQDHGSVKKHYIRAPDPKNRQVGNSLDRLRDSRNQADYSDTINKLEELAKAAISQSKQVHTLLKQIYRS